MGIKDIDYGLSFQKDPAQNHEFRVASRNSILVLSILQLHP